MSQFGKRGDIIEIRWVDSCSLQGWVSLDAVEEFGKDCRLYRTVGYIYGIRKNHLLVCQSISDYKHAEQRLDGVFKIPVVAIKDWRELK